MSWCTGDKFVGEYIWTNNLDLIPNMLALGYLCRSKFTNSVCLVNSNRQHSCVTHWPCVQMPMYVALKIWAMRTCGPPQPGINVCLKPFLNENTEKMWACHKLSFQERLHMFTMKCHMNLYRLICDVSFPGNFLC